MEAANEGATSRGRDLGKSREAMGRLCGPRRRVRVARVCQLTVAVA